MKNLTKASLFVILILQAVFSTAQSISDKVASFYVSVQDYYGASGHSILYLVTKDSLKIFTNCDFVGCGEELRYKQKIDDIAADKFSKLVSAMRIDTLKNRYKNPGFDGLVRGVIIQENNKNPKVVLLERIHHPTIGNLIFELRKLIADENFRTMR